MTIETIIVAITVAALGAAGIVEIVRAIVAATWPARTASLRWVWRVVAVVAGGALGYFAEGDVEHLAIGLGAGTLTTAVVGAIKARLPQLKTGDPKSEEIER